jgi:hypothetical protein
MHGGHLDLFRGGQATVVMKMSDLLEIRRYRLQMTLRTLPQRLLLQRLLDYGTFETILRLAATYYLNFNP